MSSETPPMTAWGKARFDAAKPVYGPRAVMGGLGNDPMMTCDPVGMPRYLFLEVSIYPMEFIQTSKRVLQHFEWGNTYRQIWTDGRELPKDPEPAWIATYLAQGEQPRVAVERGVLDALGDDRGGGLLKPGHELGRRVALEQ